MYANFTLRVPPSLPPHLSLLRLFLNFHLPLPLFLCPTQNNRRRAGKEKYIPLLKRTTAENYESRVAHVSGSRKIRLDRHLDLRESNERDGKQFFEHLRAQGNIDYEAMNGKR